MRGRRRYTGQSRIVVSRAVRSVCNLLAAVMLGYAVFAGDVPVGLVSIAVLIGNLQSYRNFLPFTVGEELGHALHVCSITMFIGAILMVIFY